MKLNIISDDFELVNKLKEVSTLTVKSISEEEINDSGIDILVVSNRCVGLNKLLILKSNDAKCFYLSSQEDALFIEKLDKSILELNKIFIIPPKRTINQIQELILNKVFKSNSENNVFTFFGSDSKVGTTSVAQSVAVNIAKRHKNKSVFMLFLDGQDGFDWIDIQSNKSCLADIKVALKNNFLTVASLKENSYRYAPNLYLLKGEMSLDESVYYHQNEINLLINLCKDNFDFVIIDAGNTMNLYLRMTYSGLVNSDNKILVTDQMPKSYEMYVKGKNQVLDNLKIGDFKFLVLNKYIQNSILSKKEDLADKYFLPIVSVLPYLDFHFQALSEKSISMFETEKLYKNGIFAIVKYIEKKIGLEIGEVRKKGLLSFVGK